MPKNQLELVKYLKSMLGPNTLAEWQDLCDGSCSGEGELHDDDADRMWRGLSWELRQPGQEGLHDHPPTGVQGDHGAAVQGRAQNRVQEGKDKWRAKKYELSYKFRVSLSLS